MREPLLRHEVVGLEGSFQVGDVDADRASHQHVLGSLGNLAIHLEQVGLLERLEPEEVVLKVARKVYLSVDSLVVVSDDVVDFRREQRCIAPLSILIVVQLVGNVKYARLRSGVELADSHAVGELGVVRVDDGHVGASLCRQIRNLL